jgi:hypothetical protein
MAKMVLNKKINMSKIYVDYKRHIRAILTEHGRESIIVGGIPLRFSQEEGIPVNEGGIIVAREPDLIFREGQVYSYMKLFASSMAKFAVSNILIITNAPTATSFVTNAKPQPI